MKEDLLHYVWKYRLFFTNDLISTNNDDILVLKNGTHNQNSGPDFFNAQVKIGEQLWAGNVEIHLKSSDWYIHNHEKDKNYDNVILHVVWEHDVEIHNNENVTIPTLELKEYVSKELLNSYQKLFSKPQKWINCENQISSIDSFVMNNWFERLYFERLERKSVLINELLSASKFDWEAVLFRLLAKNFGLKVNAESFFEMANMLDFSIVRKESGSQENLESLLFGQLGMLNDLKESQYFNVLKSEYNYQSKKYKLKTVDRSSVQYFRLRPTNFPTIRISQLACLYNLNQNLFSKLVQIENLDDFYKLFSVSTSEFWETHYTFEKESKKQVKKLTKSFVDLLLINTIIPLKFVYLRYIGKLNETEIIGLIEQIKPEKNSIIENFADLKVKSINAFQTQSLLQLKNEYCAPQKCLQCAIGNVLLKN
ncbi:DUF2851 family protein [Urechidicola croceus]|uniref:DUF2851 domain-containing protein n=1 Tax=Urechidicola croceus TaxID=1850246 RepID=A0A1D8P6L5_9FLAO|nr:DUF2851 family protein [Urechidicola croceus]AOW20211.1 hypothetical protein LPB138_05760 [Urechidicola croceus]